MMGSVANHSRAFAAGLVRWCVRLAVLVVVVWSTVMLVGAFASRHGPPLEPWHTIRLETEYQAGKPGMPVGWAGYLALEGSVFEEAEARLTGHPIDDAVDRWSRYLPDSPSRPGARGPNWNRSITFGPVGAGRGAVALLHGLTDSPYSVRAVGELFAARGLHVIAPRMPGHGTHPGGLLHTGLEDWRAVVDMAIREACRLAGNGDFYIGGYSTGAALALEWTMARLEKGDGQDCFPDRIFMFSAAVEITAFASLAASHRLIAALPWFRQFHWAPILPEYDPWKYNSFPKIAGHQVWRLTRDNSAALARLAAQDRLGELPPVTAFQSLVDNTVLTRGLVNGLFRRIHNPDSELVLFDMNRYGAMDTFLARDYDDVVEDLMNGPPTEFRVVVVSNLAPDTASVGLWQRDPGGPPDTLPEPVGLAWPGGVYSLSHVALVFPPDDPTYGAGSDEVWFPGLASPRGEVGVLAVPLDLFMRLRWNPFFEVVESRIDHALGGP
jgi:alpha-beta hydrolase superfamily lysophospholipase